MVQLHIENAVPLGPVQTNWSPGWCFVFLALVLMFDLPPQLHANSSDQAGDTQWLDAVGILDSQLQMAKLVAAKQDIGEDETFETIEPIVQTVSPQPNLATLRLSDDGTLRAVGSPLGSKMDPNSEPPVVTVIENGLKSAQRSLIQEHISALADTSDNRNKDALQNMVERVRSIRFKPKQKKPMPADDAEPQLHPEPSQNSDVQTEVDELPVELEDEPGTAPQQSLGYEPVSDKTLKQLAQLAQEPDKVRNPLLLADILQLSEQYEYAARFYSLALTRDDENPKLASTEKAWLLFQLANCLRQVRPAEALQFYRRLLAEHPQCPWAAAAKAQENITDWAQTDQPYELLEQCQSQLSKH